MLIAVNACDAASHTRSPTPSAAPANQPTAAPPEQVTTHATLMLDDLIALSDAITARMAFPLDFAELSEPERNFIVAWVLLGQVNNGGFDQYFFNSTGDQAALAPAALRSVGADEAALLVDEALAVFGPAGPPTDRQSRWTVMDSMSPSDRGLWNDMDNRFYEIADLNKTLLAYVQANRSAFQP
jgi:hypothetical protein